MAAAAEKRAQAMQDQLSKVLEVCCWACEQVVMLVAAASVAATTMAAIATAFAGWALGPMATCAGVHVWCTVKGAQAGGKTASQGECWTQRALHVRGHCHSNSWSYAPAGAYRAGRFHGSSQRRHDSLRRLPC
jgi:hypothetical protein